MTHLNTIAIACALSLSISLELQAVELVDNQFKLDIDPTTLAINWLTTSGEITASQGSQLKATTDIVQISKNTVGWLWPKLNIHAQAKLNNNELLLTFQTTQGSSQKKSIAEEKPQMFHWFTLPVQETDELLLPLAEGFRVPIADSKWQQYLTNNFEKFDATWDLKLPFWSQISQGKTISWIMLTPYNNQLSFQQQDSRLQLTASHELNQLNSAESFSVLIHLGDDLLSGAKRYRTYLQQQKQLPLLKEKVAKVANGKKLIGATHLYVWGDQLLGKQDIKNWQGLANYLKSPQANWLSQYFSKEQKSVLKEIKSTDKWLSQYHKNNLVDMINQAVVQSLPLSVKPNSDQYIDQQYLVAQQRKQLINEKMGELLKSADNWGQGLAKPVIESLQAAKLTKLLMLTPSWTPAFYQPKAIKLAKQAGYLIGTYDSYNTAIPLGVNDNWLTAQIPDQLRENCAIVLQDGRKKKGFQGKGAYTNPLCMMPYFKQRSEKIMRYGGFNSIFLDADATGMLYADYHPQRLHSQSAMASGFNHRLQWTLENYKYPLGSEDGNAINTPSILFAHGIETMGFGWRDQDMHKNKQSPYYLGSWWPDKEPAFFFKSAKVKEPYKSLLFAPEFQIPLYQTVFHDAVINSHHWHTDSLKFSDVKVSRDLTAMLYNTPPMMHISRNTLKKRLPALKHYAKGFQTIHEKLWDKALVKFVDLTKDRKVQQTTFSDGTTITANFSDKNYQFNKQSIKANTVFVSFADGKQFFWHSQ